MPRGSFFAHEVGPPGSPGEGISLAYQWGLRQSPKPTVMIGQIPRSVANALMQKTTQDGTPLLQNVAVPGLPGVSQLIFHPESYEIVNAYLEWVQFISK